VRHAGIQRQEKSGLSTGFVFAAADDAGGLEIKFGKIGAGLPTAGFQLDGALEFNANFLGQASRFYKSGTIRFLAVNSSQPKMIKTVAGVEGDSFSQAGLRVPVVEFDMGAAEQVVASAVGAARICCSSIWMAWSTRRRRGDPGDSRRQRAGVRPRVMS